MRFLIEGAKKKIPGKPKFAGLGGGLYGGDYSGLSGRAVGTFFISRVQFRRKVLYPWGVQKVIQVHPLAWNVLIKIWSGINHLLCDIKFGFCVRLPNAHSHLPATSKFPDRRVWIFRSSGDMWVDIQGAYSFEKLVLWDFRPFWRHAGTSSIRKQEIRTTGLTAAHWGASPSRRVAALAHKSGQ